jgi:hypothetical protein
MAANRQFRTIDAEADYAEHWMLGHSAPSVATQDGRAAFLRISKSLC